MNPLTVARQALTVRLETIATGSGYFTDAGSRVRTGWLNEVLKEHGITYPLIVVQMAKPEQGAVARGGSVKVPLAFNVIGAVQVGLDYEEGIDDLTADLMRCLVPGDGISVPWRSPEMSEVRIKPPEFFPPGDGLNAATVLVQVELSVILRGA